MPAYQRIRLVARLVLVRCLCARDAGFQACFKVEVKNRGGGLALKISLALPQLSCAPPAFAYTQTHPSAMFSPRPGIGSGLEPNSFIPIDAMAPPLKASRLSMSMEGTTATTTTSCSEGVALGSLPNELWVGVLDFLSTVR